MNKCESLGWGNSWSFTRIHRQLQGILLHMWQSSEYIFLPNVNFQWWSTLGHDFDIFAPSGDSTAWVLLWKTRARPIGVRLFPVVQCDCFSTTFNQREWTMVTFWKEDSKRLLRLITHENEGRDKTDSPSPPRFSFIMFLFDPPDTPPAPPEPPGPPDSPGLPPGLPPAPRLMVGEEEQELKMYRVSHHDHDLHHWSLN